MYLLTACLLSHKRTSVKATSPALALTSLSLPPFFFFFSVFTQRPLCLTHQMSWEPPFSLPWLILDVLMWIFLLWESFSPFLLPLSLWMHVVCVSLSHSVCYAPFLESVKPQSFMKINVGV